MKRAVVYSPYSRNATKDGNINVGFIAVVANESNKEKVTVVSAVKADEFCEASVT